MKDGIRLFKELSRKKSDRIVHMKKGVAICDLGEITSDDGVRTRIIIVLRISRTRKNGKVRVNTCYHGIASDLELSTKKLYEFCHRRQCIEAGFRELRNHWHLERLPIPTSPEKKVLVRSDSGYKWLLQRLLAKTARMETVMNLCK